MNHASSIWTNFVPVLALVLLLPLLVLVSAAGASGTIVIISVSMIVNINIFLGCIFGVTRVARSIAFITDDINRPIVWMARLNPSPLIFRAIRFILIA
jgi:ABC-type polysaccharide/polyol phosphate export permease